MNTNYEAQLKMIKKITMNNNEQIRKEIKLSIHPRKNKKHAETKESTSN